MPLSRCVELNNVSHEELEEIKNEVNLLRTLRHRHVVSYVGTHSMENSFNILMEYCPVQALPAHPIRHGGWRTPAAAHTHPLYRTLFSPRPYTHPTPPTPHSPPPLPPREGVSARC